MSSISKGGSLTRTSPINPPTNGKGRILMVAGDLSSLERISQVLRAEGYDVLTETHGRKALRIIGQYMPDLVVLDAVLPDLSGIEVCKQIKENPDLRDVFVILISAQAISPGQAVDGLSIGADEYLFAPLEPKEFLARIHTMARLMEATQVFRANEQHYRRLLEILPDAVAVIDKQFRLASLNERAVAMLGYSDPRELLGKDIFDVIQTRDHEGFRADITSLKNGDIRRAEYVLLRRDGRSIPVEMSVALSTSPNGRSLGLITVIRDISDRKIVEEELRRLPERITDAQEAERLRVARELHDGVNQVIASAAMRLRRAQDSISAQNPAAWELLSRCHKLLVQALEETRRISRNLRPNDLDELGLSAACRNLCQELQARTGLVIKCQLARFDRVLPREVDLSLFRMVQESLNNVEKHAGAKLVRLRIALQRDTILLKVQDDGRGFDPVSPKLAKGARRGIGLSSLRGRATALGGTFEVESGPKKGTSITIRVPLPKERRSAETKK